MAASAPRTNVLKVVRENWLLVAAVPILLGVVAYGLTYLFSPVYQATATLFLADARSAGVFGVAQPLGDPSTRVFTEAAQMQSATVLGNAAENLDGMSLPELASRVAGIPNEELGAIAVRSTAPTAAGATDIANAVAEAYIDTATAARRSQAQEALDGLETYEVGVREDLTEIDAKLTDLRNDAERTAAESGRSADTILAADPNYQATQGERSALYNELLSVQRTSQQMLIDVDVTGAGIDRFESAVPPPEPAAPRRSLTAGAAAVLGLLAITAFAMWREERKLSPLTPQTILEGPLLGEIPMMRATPERPFASLLAEPGSSAAEAFEFASLAIADRVRSLGGPGHAGEADVVVVVGALPKSGSTTAAINLAVAAARIGRRVVMIDADLESRGLSTLMKADGSTGLTDMGAGDGTAAEAELGANEVGARRRIDDDNALWVIPAGIRATNAFAFFTSAQFGRALGELRQDKDLVVVDAPAALTAVETLAIAREATGILLVVDRRSSVDVLSETRWWLDRAGAPLIGYVFNDGARESMRDHIGGARNRSTAPSQRMSRRQPSRGRDLAYEHDGAA